MGTAPGTLEVPLPPSLASRLGNGRGIDVTANSVLGTRDLEGGGLEALTMCETNWQREHNVLALYLQGQLAGVAKMVSHDIFQYNVLVIDIDNTTLVLI